MNTNREFFRLFFNRELSPLVGTKMSNLFILVVMLFTTFTVIGFAEGSLHYLKRKMKDPFINWVHVLPGYMDGSRLNSIIRSLNSEKIKETYQVSSTIGYFRFQPNFYDYNAIREYYATGQLDTTQIHPLPSRTMESDDPILGQVFDEGNLIKGVPFANPMDIGFIVTKSALDRLNYPLDTRYLWMDIPAIDREQGNMQVRRAIPVPVRGIVTSLPGLADLSSTEYFFLQRYDQQTGRNPFNPMNENTLILALFGSREQANVLVDDLNKFFQNKEDLYGYRLHNIRSPEKRDHGLESEHFLIPIHFSPDNIPMRILDEIFRDIYNSTDLHDHQASLYRMHDYGQKVGRPRPPTFGYDRISVHFANLDNLRKFNIMLFDQHNLQIDMAVIESRENYYFVSRLTRVISIVLILFSIVSVLLFVGHLLKKHLEGIKRNLGTFKAFGLSNCLVINTYVWIVLSILGSSTLLALALSALFGYLGGMRILLILFRTPIEPGRYFDLNSPYLLAALLVLTAFSVIVLRWITIRILDKTPGDLIYERK